MSQEPKIITFKNDGTEWSAWRQAEDFLRRIGYSVGSMERRFPIGIAKGDAYISKWTGMTREERAELDGRIESESFRNGDVRIIFTKPQKQ